MPECHRCLHMPRVSSGLLQNVPWSKTPCASCNWTGAGQNNHGASHISLDAVSDAARRDDQSYSSVMSALALFLAEISEEAEMHRRATSSHFPRHMARKAAWAQQIKALLTEAQARYLTLRVENPGVQDRDIAAMMNCTPQNVSALRKHMIAKIHEHRELVSDVMAYYRRR